jgi:cytochrome oxidase Cu insertion factor (SCO1/SenC/PrrC family)
MKSATYLLAILSIPFCLSASDASVRPGPKTKAPQTTTDGCCEAAESQSAPSTVSPWLPPGRRILGLPENALFLDQDGRKVSFQDLIGKPIALSFMYTRCQNQNKCPLVSATMAELQRDLGKAGLGGKVRLALVTYDPEFDSPPVLNRYGREYHFHFDQNTMLLDPLQKAALFDALKIGVNFNSEGVNVHTIQLLLFDKHGKKARTYRSVIWNNEKVVTDLKRLLGET